MRRYINYFWLVICHKYWVFVFSMRYGVGLWQALVHDLSKFHPIEFIPYAKVTFEPDGTKKVFRDSTGSYDPNKMDYGFERAWCHHQRNKHHWQAWVSIGTEGNLSPVPMPVKYVREMLADWSGASKTHNGIDIFTWWGANRSKMVLHPITVTRINKILIDILTKDIVKLV